MLCKGGVGLQMFPKNPETPSKELSFNCSISFRTRPTKVRKRNNKAIAVHFCRQKIIEHWQHVSSTRTVATNWAEYKKCNQSVSFDFVSRAIYFSYFQVRTMNTMIWLRALSLVLAISCKKNLISFNLLTNPALWVQWAQSMISTFLKCPCRYQYQYCQYIDNRYPISIYRTGLRVRQLCTKCMVLIIPG